MLKRTLAPLSLLVLAGATSAQAVQVQSTPDVTGLRAFQIQRLSLPGDAQQAFQTLVEVEGEPVLLDLAPHSIRSDDFTVWVHDGTAMQRVDVPAPTTFRGRALALDGQPLEAGTVTAALTARGWRMQIPLAEGAPVVVQPMAEFVAPDEVQATTGQYVVFRADQDELLEPITCGNGDEGVPHDEAEHGIQRGGGPGRRVVEIAYDTDVEYTNTNGGSVTATIADIESITNTMDAVYDDDVDVIYELTAIIVRTGATSSDPYTTNDPSGLLNQFAAFWAANATAVQRDIAHLMTGRNLAGSTIGIAALGAACSMNSGYGLSQTRFSANFTRRVALTAHEVGHNLGAGHCNGCSSGDMDCSIMCSGLGGCNGVFPLRFGSCARGQLIPFSNGASCFQTEPALLSVPFYEDFREQQTSNLGPEWQYNRIAFSIIEAQNPISGEFTLKMNSVGTASHLRDDLRSWPLALAGESNLRLSFFTQDRDVEVGEELVVEYKAVTDDATEWSELTRVDSDGVNQSDWDFHAIDLPLDAYHDGFRMRFRLETDLVDDTWFVEDIQLADRPALAVSHLVGGQTASWNAYGFAPGEFVGFYYSLLGTGVGPTVLGGGVTFGILDPVLINDAFYTTDGNGVATLDIPGFPSLPPLQIWSQALLIRFPLPNSVLSNVQVRTFQ